MSSVIEVAIEQPPSVSVALKDVLRASREARGRTLPSKAPERRRVYNSRYYAREKGTIWRRPYQRRASVAVRVRGCGGG